MFTFTKYRRTRSPLQLQPLYDLHQPGVFIVFHATHADMTQAEADALVARAEARRREGSIYIPEGLSPESLRNFHVV